jgi:hypothetical protein
MRGWVCSRAGLDVFKYRKTSIPAGIRTPDLPACRIFPSQFINVTTQQGNKRTKMKEHDIRAYLSSYLLNHAMHQMRSLMRSTALMTANTTTVFVKVKAHRPAQKSLSEV